MTGLAVTKRWGLSLSPVVWRGRGGLGCDGGGWREGCRPCRGGGLV